VNVVVASGIGDFSWAWSKLCNLNCNYHVGIAQTGGPMRLAPFLELLPKVKSHSRVKMDFAQLKAHGVPANTSIDRLTVLRDTEGDVYTEANSHIETGNRIESWLPEIPVDYHYDIHIKPEHAEDALKYCIPSPFVVLYTSQISTATTWKGWLPTQWVEFMTEFRKKIGDVYFVIVGAVWDVDMAAQITALAAAKKSKIRVHNLVGQLHIGSTLHLMNLAKYTVAFPSGIAVLCDVICAPATMFWPKILPHINMVGKFADPESIASHRFYEPFFCEPSGLVNWLRDVYKMKDHL
jgi:hypothetical protein